jgi:conjugal transfer pilus assembly protein TraA
MPVLRAIPIRLAPSTLHALALALCLLATTVSIAGTTGAEFQSLHTLLQGWAEGYLGRALAIAAFLVGAAIGFARGTAFPALVGLVFAVVFAIGPGVINGLISGVI